MVQDSSDSLCCSTVVNDRKGGKKCTANRTVLLKVKNPICFLADLEARVDDTVGFHGRHHDIGDPEQYKDARGDGLDSLGTTQLAADCGVPSCQQNQDGDQSLGTENGHRETQAVKTRTEISHFF